MVTHPTSKSKGQAIYEQHCGRLVRVAFLLTGDRGLAEDAVHDVFTQCWGRIDDLEVPSQYLRVAVVNRCRSQHRKLRRAEARSVLPETGQLPPQHENRLELLEALGRLTYRKRAAVVLRFYEDLPDEEIARVLGCRRSTVRSLVARGLSQMKEELSK